MGRAYTTELGQLAETYAFGCNVDIEGVRTAVDSLRQHPLLVVGSGGSLTACHFAARLHEYHARLPARVLTPLEFLEYPRPQAASVLLLSARGGNPDILAAADHAIREEFAVTVALTTTVGTPLKQLFGRSPHATSFEIAGPALKDGFLATNSLLLTCSIVARAYGVQLPAALPAIDRFESVEVLGRSEVFKRSNLILFAHGWSVPAAMDFESKWAEIGFGTVSVTDSRNFAHGRHVGFARRINETGIVSLAARNAGINAQHTLSRLPSKAVSLHVESELRDAAGAIDLIAHSIIITGVVGRRLGRDPGRPRVPAFGRALYRAKLARRGDAAGEHESESWWISRKVTPVVWHQASEELRASWRNEFYDWHRRVTKQRIGALVLDYDGTLCEAHERFTAPSPIVGEQLGRLLELGMIIGIATGRGDSVITALRSVIAPHLWSRMYVGMYNGAVIGTLDKDLLVQETADTRLNAVYDVLRNSSLLAGLVTFRIRPFQLTIHPRRPLPAGLLQRFILETTAAHELLATVQVCGSGHSVDIFSQAAAKRNVVDRVRAELVARGKADLSIMAIGDQGQFGGNDAALLSTELGISVEKTSSVLSQCWNLAPRGARTSVASLTYLADLVYDGTSFRWSAAMEEQGGKPRESGTSPTAGRRAGAR